MRESNIQLEREKPSHSYGFNPLANSARQSESKLEPQTYVHSGTTSKHRKPRKPRKLKSESLIIRLQTKAKIVEHLLFLGEKETAESIALCGEKFSVMRCDDHLLVKTPYHRCNVRYCPMCASRRASKKVRQYLPAALEFAKRNPRYVPCLLTLTQKKLKGERKRDARMRIYESFKKLTRQKGFQEYFAGGIWACEITESDNGNHSHLHIIIFRRKFVDEKLLKTWWAAVSPEAKNLNIKRIDDLENGLRECIKYIAKPVPAEHLTRDTVKQLLELKGVQMINTFGEFREFCADFEPEETEPEEKPEFVVGECCPHCTKPIFQQTLSYAELIAYYRRRERSNAGRIRDKLQEKIL
jgi:hypothetical protein